MPAKKRRLLAVLFGTAVAVFLFASFEGVFYVANRLRPEPFVEMVVPEYKPDSTTRAAYTADGEVVYDVTYSFDERQLREIPANPTGVADRRLYFFGGSFTFGQGVEDDETLPNYMAKTWPGTMVHNIGSPGMGTLHVYERIGMVRDDFDGGSTAEIIGVYVFIPSHVQRNIGSMRLVATWAKDFPYYEFDESGKPRKTRYDHYGPAGVVRFSEINFS